VRNHGGCVAKPSHHGKRKERVSCGPPVAFSLLVHVTATKYHTWYPHVLPYVITPSLVIPRVRAPLPVTLLINTVRPPRFKPTLSLYIPSIRAAIFIIHTTNLPFTPRAKAKEERKTVPNCNFFFLDQVNNQCIR
jgi:hypothetical protein